MSCCKTLPLGKKNILEQELGASGRLWASASIFLGRLGQERGARSSPARSRLTHGHSFPLLCAKAASRQEPGSQGLCHALQHQVLCKRQQNRAKQKYATIKRKGQATPAAESGETQGRTAGSHMKSLLVAHLYVTTIQKSMAGKTLKKKAVRSDY